MSQHKNSQQIGLYIAISLVVGNMIGSGIFMLPAAMAGIGSISLFGWILSGIGALLIAGVFSRLSKLVPRSGGPYIYAKEGFGDYVGFLSGWGYWTSVLLTNASIAMAFTGYLLVFIPSWSGNQLALILIPISAIWLLTWLNALGVKTGGQMQLLTTVLKLIPLLAISFLGLFFFKSGNLEPFNSSGTSDLTAIGVSISLTLFAFLGIESATIPAANIKNPSVTIPRATLYGTLITLLIYIIGSIAIMGIIPQDELRLSTAPFADAAGIMWGTTGRYLVGFGAIVSTFGALNGWILIQAQIPFAMSADVLLPPIFKKKSARDLPIYSLLISSLLVTVIVLATSSGGLVEIFKFLILVGTFLALISYVFSSMSEVLILIHNKPEGWSKKLVRAFLLGLPAFLFSMIAVYGCGLEIVFFGFIILMAGTPIYIWSKVKQVQTREK
jgi:APA family basic amino acid/polyamine antiporter